MKSVLEAVLDLNEALLAHGGREAIEIKLDSRGFSGISKELGPLAPYYLSCGSNGVSLSCGTRITRAESEEMRLAKQLRALADKLEKQR